MATADRRTAVLIVRVWIEHDGPGGLRARITHSLDIAGHNQTVTSAASVDDVCDTVRSWLETFLDDRPIASEG